MSDNDIIKTIREITLMIAFVFLMLMIIETADLPSTQVSITLTENVSFVITTSIEQLIAMVIVVGALTAITGLQVVGTGINDEGVKTFLKIVSNLIIWYISMLGFYYNLNGLPSNVIHIIVIIFTLFYALGFARNLGGND